MPRHGGQKCDSSNIISIFETRPDQMLDTIYHHAVEESDSEVKERAYQTLLPVVKRLVQLYKNHPDLGRRSEFRIACAVCPELTHFRGWGPLLIHAHKFWKSFPLQHHGYHRALEEILKREGLVYAKMDALAWPPVLLVENAGLTFEGSFRRWKGLQGVEVPSNWREIEIQEVLAIYRKGKGGDLDVMVFPASEVGLVDAKKFTEVLQNIPNLNDWVRFNVEKLACLQCTSFHQESLGKHDDDPLTALEMGDEIEEACNNSIENSPSSSETSFDIDKHHPLGTWATLNEILEMNRVDSIMRKWAKSLREKPDFCTFKYKWPFQKSRELKEMDIKFQKDLQNYHSVGAVGNEKLRAQLEEIEKQLRKERLLWLKEIDAAREQFESLEKDLKKEEIQKALDKHIREMRLKREMATKVGKLEELADEKDKVQIWKPSWRGRQQHNEHIQEMQRRRDALLKAWRCEQNQFRKQAELAKEERECIIKNIENEELLDALCPILESCNCSHKDENKDSGCCSCGVCSVDVKDVTGED